MFEVGYSQSKSVRQELLAAEAQVLARCDLIGLKAWESMLGLSAPPRTEPGIDVPSVFSAASDRAPRHYGAGPLVCHELFVEAALASVLFQSYSGFELLSRQRSIA